MDEFTEEVVKIKERGNSSVEERRQKNTMPYYNRGNAYSEEQKWEAAIADYSKAIEINPEYISAYFNRGIVLTNMVNIEAAIAELEKE